MNVPNNKYFEHPILNPRYIKKNYPEFFDYLNLTYPDIKSISEKIYWWKYNLKEIPKCPICGKPNHFLGINKGYTQTCSSKCSANYDLVQNKSKQTCLKKYGTENPQQNKDIQEKTKQTNIERYGVDNPFKSEIIKEKIKQDNLEKYGVEYIGQIDTIKNKIKETFINKYGVESALELPQTQINREKNRKQRVLARHEEINDISNNLYICNCPHPNCNKCIEKYYEIEPNHYFDRKRDHTEPCTRLLPIGKANNNGTSIELYIRYLLDEMGIEYQTNVYGILNKKELDIYIPSKKIAIECNGVFTHSTYSKDPNYHINKSKECAEHGIQLIHIWEDWIKNKSEIVESIIKSKLGIYKERIGARKCIIKEIKSKECNIFLDNNHIQGRTTSNIKLGLFYNNELVSIMTFNKKRGCQGNKNIEDWELNRFCNKLNTQVIGGASKLMNYFIKKYNPEKIISFSSNDISNGNLYKQLGFKTDNNINNSYWYIKPGTMKRYHRSTFTKAAIVKLGWKEHNDKSWTEDEVMKEHRYLKIYDSGQIKWIYKNPGLN